MGFAKTKKPAEHPHSWPYNVYVISDIICNHTVSHCGPIGPLGEKQHMCFHSTNYQVLIAPDVPNTLYNSGALTSLQVHEAAILGTPWFARGYFKSGGRGNF